jgi:hypothetical protein
MLISTGLNPYKRVPATYLEPNAKEDIVQEEESHAGFRNLCLMRVARQLVVTNHDRNDQVTEALACCSVHEHLPPAPTLDVGNTNSREEQVADTVDCGQQTSHLLTEANGLDEDCRQIVRGDVDAW